MTKALVVKKLSVVALSLAMIILIVFVVLPIEAHASQSLNSSHMKVAKVLKLGEYNESYFHRFDSFPQLSYSEPNKVYVLWHNSEEFLNKFNQTDYNETGMIVKVSIDNGNSFNPPLNVRNSSELYSGKIRNNYSGGLVNLAEDAVVTDPILSSNNNEVYVGWVEYPSTGFDFDFIIKRSVKNGTSFEPFINLSNESSYAQEPAIAAGDNNTVFLAWNGVEYTTDNKSSDVFEFKRSHDGGKTFERNVSLRNYNLSKPLMATSGNDIYLAGYDGTNMILTKSTDLGEHFNQPLKLPIENPKFLHFRLAASGNNTFMVWDDASGIYFEKNVGNGTLLNNSVKLSNRTLFCGSASQPDISARNDKVYVVWQGTSCGKFGSDIFLTRSLDGGKTFSNVTNLSNNTFASGGNLIFSTINSNYPQIVTSNNGTFITWENKYANHGDIMFSKID
jgi:hypothetical protein